MSSKGKILVAMSGGVDSSVAAVLLQREGYEVTGVTLKLWGGPSDTGCCSVSDVTDARRVADHLGIEHHVFNFGDEFESHVVVPYVRSHASGLTPNPCIECNRYLKFDKLIRRANALGFDLIATGHHARIIECANGVRIGRGADSSKDQSYVLYMLNQQQLQQLKLPLGEMEKTEVREIAALMDLRVADKPDSQDVCFISNAKGSRRRFLEQRIDLTPAKVLDKDSRPVGEVDSLEMVTIGQRKGLGLSGQGAPKYAVDIDVEHATVTVGQRSELFCMATKVKDLCWVGEPYLVNVDVQTSAHGQTAPASVRSTVDWVEPHVKVAPGQSLVFYDGDLVVGSAIAT
tara:strand:+ start:1160 stop:2194 length:1035 start_codon:yes stop_codon:yes gene_type:complete